MAFRIINEFSHSLPERPGSCAKKLTWYLAVDTRAWLRKHIVVKVAEDYVNIFEMSNGMPAEIGTIEIVWFRSWSESKAFDEFWALHDRAKREGTLL